MLNRFGPLLLRFFLPISVPTLDKELASLVLDAKHGELGPTIDQLLEMGSS
jgi:hypothetical protein